jgi:hypothetical protein
MQLSAKLKFWPRRVCIRGYQRARLVALRHSGRTFWQSSGKCGSTLTQCGKSRRFAPHFGAAGRSRRRLGAAHVKIAVVCRPITPSRARPRRGEDLPPGLTAGARRYAGRGKERVGRRLEQQSLFGQNILRMTSMASE